MHANILSEKQTALLPFLADFQKDFGLVGGTAVALHLGHRQSIDFDLFSLKNFSNSVLRKKIQSRFPIEKILVDEAGEYTILVEGVKISFVFYPFPIEFADDFQGILKVADLETLGAMKTYVLGRRNKWKDYVDIFFIAKEFGGLKKIIQKADQIFSVDFNEKIFRSQLAYFDDIDFSEKVYFMEGFEKSEEEIKKTLVEFSLEN